jgi:hypothetical protein
LISGPAARLKMGSLKHLLVDDDKEDDIQRFDSMINYSTNPYDVDEFQCVVLISLLLL